MSKEKIRYRNFTMRLSQKTKKWLKKEKNSSGKSWNLFIYSLLQLLKLTKKK